MNEYRLRSNGQIVTEKEFRLSYPDISFPAVLDEATMDEYNADPILKSPMPTAGLYQSVIRSGAVQDNLGNWVESWSLVDWDQSTTDTYLTETRSQLWEQIKEIRTDKSLNGGVYYGTKWFNTDLVSRSQYLRLKNKADMLVIASAAPETVLQANGADILWKTMDGSFVTVTIDLIINLMDALDDREAAIFTQSEILKAAVDVSTNPISVDIQAGWPSSFGE